MRFKTWMIEIRAPFLLLPIILAAVGSVLTINAGHFNALNFAIFALIIVLLHISVNTLNEYFDHKTKIDMHTRRTMFNGGSGDLQAGALRPKEVLTVALVCFALASMLSVYLILAVSWLLILDHHPRDAVRTFLYADLRKEHARRGRSGAWPRVPSSDRRISCTGTELSPLPSDPGDRFGRPDL